MTVLISLPHPQMIIMCADSRKTISTTQVNYDLEPIDTPRFEYAETQKLFLVPGVGCATMWGEITRAELDFPNYLSAHQSEVRTIEDLRLLVENYLRFDLEAELDGEDVGFHVGGFTPDGIPKLYHVFWGWDRPRIEGQIPKYNSYSHEDYLAVYNGRNDFVEPIMTLLIALQQQVEVTIFNDDPIQRIILVDFITRYISQFTPEVGGDIHTALITPDNRFMYIKNGTGTPIPRNSLTDAFGKFKKVE